MIDWYYLAACIGCRIPVIQATPPAFISLPSITAASISTVPKMVSFEPRPALKAGSSSITLTAAIAASSAWPVLKWREFVVRRAGIPILLFFNPPFQFLPSSSYSRLHSWRTNIQIYIPPIYMSREKKERQIYFRTIKMHRLLQPPSLVSLLPHTTGKPVSEAKCQSVVATKTIFYLSLSMGHVKYIKYFALFRNPRSIINNLPT